MKEAYEYIERLFSDRIFDGNNNHYSRPYRQTWLGFCCCNDRPNRKRVGGGSK